MTTWLSRSRTNVRITRGEKWLLASWRLTTVSEKATPAVVMVAPATVLSSQVAVLLLIPSVRGTARSAPVIRSSAPAVSARAIPPTTMSAGSRKRLSRKR
ncbi:hypothetical protein GCM10027300_08890 [Modestobacter lapidis]